MKKQKASRQTWFREKPLPVPVVDKKQMLISFKGGSSKIAILEGGATLVEYYTAESKIKIIGWEYLFRKRSKKYFWEWRQRLSRSEKKKMVSYVADVAGSRRNSKIKIY